MAADETQLPSILRTLQAEAISGFTLPGEARLSFLSK